MPLDKKRLKRYRGNKSRLKRIDQKITELCSREVEVVSGKVVGSSEDFPYIEVRTSVQMYDPEENDNLNKQIRRKEAERLALWKEVHEVEEYIENIPDPEIKEIFELSFVEGKKQQEIAEQLHIDRSYVSKKINSYLKDSHFSQK
jgi:DNA-directed RNA polymerase specialized sigma subunit|uniref:RNA polymerase sigma factor 70 region 4 type 2 domain-containing protein n=1 Tax=Siphoviridae sp. ctuy39 TaxID=2825719 RepID=A0A8S5VE51_9CAUD|nr:MAG TPA: Protein of unknown function (DUF722) [Siphoviridae sp. ctuy39]